MLAHATVTNLFVAGALGPLIDLLSSSQEHTQIVAASILRDLTAGNREHYDAAMAAGLSLCFQSVALLHACGIGFTTELTAGMLDSNALLHACGTGLPQS